MFEVITIKKIILVLVCLFLLGCAAEEAPIACTDEAKICPDGSTVGRIPPDCEFAPCPAVAEMSLEEAIAIASESDCVAEGALTDTTMYNEITKTWWIDLDLEKEGCAPACVVNVETKTAEINWRCTGLITE